METTMREQRYDFDVWLRNQIERPLSEVRKGAHAAIEEAERGSYRVKGAIRKREAGSTEFASRVNNFLFLIQHGRKPSGASAEDWEAMRPVVESFVRQGELKPTILDLWTQ